MPSSQPVSQPSSIPSSQPSSLPSSQPSSEPTNPTSSPTNLPSSQPSGQPTMNPTNPTSTPTSAPSSVETWWEAAISYTKVHPTIIASAGMCFVGLLVYAIIKFDEIRDECSHKKRRKVVPAENVGEESDHPFFNSIYPEESKIELNHDHSDFHAPNHESLGDHCPINTINS